MPSHEITYSKHATKALSRLPRNTALRLRKKIEQFAAEPTSLANNVEAIIGEPGAFRLRVGDWRIIFRLADGIMDVGAVASRGSAYRTQR